MDLNDEQKKHRKQAGHIHLALMPGDKIEFKSQSWETVFDEGTLFIVTEKARRPYVCDACAQVFPVGTKYIGGHSWHCNYPKICKACALKIFADHKLRHVNMETWPDASSTLRVYTIQDLMRG